jgi:amidase
MTDAGRFWSIRRLGEAYRRGETTPTAATADLLARIAAEDGRWRAYVHVAADLAMAQAEQAERELAAGLDRGPLHGVPIAVKDLCATRDMPTRAGMPRLPPLMPGCDATVVTRLRRAGAVIPGKLQMTEGATMVHHPDVAPPVNPWGEDLWTGISSSGSGVAPAAGLCAAALGSDTGGSIRYPSACCGLTGLKPTWGRVSRAGIFPLAESLDHIGPMARSAADAALVLAAIAGPDPADPSAIDAPAPDYAAALGGGLHGLAIGLDEAFICEDVDAEVSAAVLAAAKLFAEAGAAVRRVAVPAALQAEAQSARSFLAELALAHADTYPSRAEAYGPDLRGLLEAAHLASAADVLRAERARIALRRQLDGVLAETPLLILPAQPFVTPGAAEGVELMRDPPRQQRAARFTSIFDLTGHPTITLPGGFDARGAPLGVQLVARALDEATLLRAAHAFQQLTDFHVRRPPGLAA